MRILLKLEASKNFAYDTKYYSKFQGFIYRQLIGTPYSFLHQKNGYKFFCFSNIFPIKPTKKGIKPIKEGEVKYWIISSPDLGFINVIKEKLEKFIEENKKINLGEMQFYLKGVKCFRLKIRKELSIRSETPIILRISKKTYENFNVSPPKKYNYLFWRTRYPFELFLGPLTRNLIEKYKEFYKNDENLKEFEEGVVPLFQRLEFKRTVVSYVLIENKIQKFFGSLWEFHFDWLNKEQIKLLKFGLDCGFGEKNSYGFGFVNFQKRKKI